MDPRNPIPAQFRAIRDNIRMVVTGDYICCAISGPPGIGKSYVVRDELEVWRRRNSKLKVSYNAGAGTVQGIVKRAYEFRRGGIIVLDDLDSVFIGSGGSGINMMKALLDPGRHKRQISVLTKDAITKAAKQAKDNPNLPKGDRQDRFVTKVQFVWITNADLSDPDLKDYPPAARIHIQAILSRGMFPLRLTAEPRWLLDYINDLVVGPADILGTLRYEQKVEVRDWFIAHAPWLKELSPRILLQVAKAAKNYPMRWEGVVGHLLDQKERHKIGPVKLTPLSRDPARPPAKKMPSWHVDAKTGRASLPELPDLPE